MLEKLLRSKAEVKVLGVVLGTDGLHLREIARRAGVSPSEAKRELGILASLGILRREKKGNLVLFRQEPKCPFLCHLKKLYSLTEGVPARLREEIGKIKGLEYGFVFGSMAGGNWKDSSDYDVMLIGNFKEDEAWRRIFMAQKETGREINPVIWSHGEFAERLKKRNLFLKNAALGEKIWIKGDEDEFVGYVEKRFGKENRSG
jgi:predicted nucleotidyltransferase